MVILALVADSTLVAFQDLAIVMIDKDLCKIKIYNNIIYFYLIMLNSEFEK